MGIVVIIVCFCLTGGCWDGWIRCQTQYFGVQIQYSGVQIQCSNIYFQYSDALKPFTGYFHRNIPYSNINLFSLF